MSHREVFNMRLFFENFHSKLTEMLASLDLICCIETKLAAPKSLSKKKAPSFPTLLETFDDFMIKNAKVVSTGTDHSTKKKKKANSVAVAAAVEKEPSSRKHPLSTLPLSSAAPPSTIHSHFQSKINGVLKDAAAVLEQFYAIPRKSTNYLLNHQISPLREEFFSHFHARVVKNQQSVSDLLAVHSRGRSFPLHSMMIF